MTPRGYAQMRKELMRLKGLRPEIANQIEVARGHGDLSENGDYDAAKERSGMVEAKIRDFEAKLAAADIIDPRRLADTRRVVFGLTIVIEEVDSGESRRISIVGEDESDIDRGMISVTAPLGRALIGKEVGDIARVNAPGGAREYEVMEIMIDYTEEEEADGARGEESSSSEA